MSVKYSLSRNLTENFAQRVQKNLDFIIKKRGEGEDVHEVTQLVTSLLGIIVFPWEAGALHHLESLLLSDLETKGWPRWKILLDENDNTKTLGRLTRHLRNAASHRHIKFSSDDREMNMVEIEFEDAKIDRSPVNWRAKINAADLKEFCRLVTNQLEELVG